MININEQIIDKMTSIFDSDLPKFVLIKKTEKPVRDADPVSQLTELIKIFKSKNLKHSKIAITVGSRKIDKIDKVLNLIVNWLKDCGAEPAVVCSMGSHGGNTIQGQLDVLDSLGINQSSVNCPVLASDKAVRMGFSKKYKLPVYTNELILKFDSILLLNRIKEHTAFSGGIGSGLAKMLAIGLGNSRGAHVAHTWSVKHGMEEVILDLASVLIKKLDIIAGVAIVENSFGKLDRISVLRPDNLIESETKLLKYSKHLEAKLPFDSLDLLIIDKIGKDISGTGMDTNVIGRFNILGQKEPATPKYSRIFVRDISDKSLGNAIGIGLADVVHSRIIDKINWHSTYMNCLTGTGPEKAKLPAAIPSDKLAIKVCLSSIGPVNPKNARIAWIRNTRELSEFRISENLLNERFIKTGWKSSKPLKLLFDKNGNIKV